MIDLQRLSLQEILQLRFCDLHVSLDGSQVLRLASTVFMELEARNIAVKPSVWVAEEWYNPEGVCGFAIPFYLVHPRLIALERRLMFEAEGATVQECLRIIRHETAHAIDEAFKLYQTAAYAEIFGDPGKRYPKKFSVNPTSQDYVTNLNSWYAQSHPVEDFAETFAVWLTSPLGWRRKYRDWPALKKLISVDEWMRSLAGSRPLVRPRPVDSELTDNRRTIGQHYKEKRKFYNIGTPSRYDGALLEIFASKDARHSRRSALAFVRLYRTQIRADVAKPLGVPAYLAEQVLRQLSLRLKSLQLIQSKSDAETYAALKSLVEHAVQTIVQQGARLPL